MTLLEGVHSPFIDLKMNAFCINTLCSCFCVSNHCSNTYFPSDRLLFVINAIKEEIVARVEDSSPRPTNMTDTLERLIQETLGEHYRGGLSHVKLIQPKTDTLKLTVFCQRL